ncbi:MAG: hypothetical protein KJ906_00310 [Nanoarchaeota archaeon]|nr:hypothetical protein [Nanoarchaeota archaeon]
MDISMLVNLGFPQILLWLLTFAIVYGVLSQAGDGGIPKSQGTRAIIALVSAFFVLFSVPNQLIDVIAKMSSSMILMIVGVLVFIVFLETAGIKPTREQVIGKDKEGRDVKGPVEVTIFQKYPLLFAVGFLIIVTLIFIGAGGLELLGLPTLQLTDSAIMSYMFLAVVVLAIVWMVADPSKKGN